MPLDENMDTQPLLDASQAVFGAICNELKTDRGVHVETAIAAAGFLAGATMLRQSGAPLDQLPPGSPVIVDSLDERGPELMQFMSGVCVASGMPADDWNADIPAANQPQRLPVDLVAALEPAFWRICDDAQVPVELRPMVAAHTAIQFVASGRGVLDERIGRAIAALSVVGGAKTVPPRLDPA